MLQYIYTFNYGWTPLKFLFKGKNFYKEKKIWSKKMREEEKEKEDK